jgi:hypothetical protein
MFSKKVLIKALNIKFNLKALQRLPVCFMLTDEQLDKAKIGYPQEYGRTQKNILRENTGLCGT